MRPQDSLLRWLPGVLLAFLLVLHALGVADLAPVRQLDAAIHDLRVRQSGSRPPPAQIAVIDIDDASLGEIGRWPWSRAQLADLIERLFVDHGVAVVGLDIILAEADLSSGLPVLQAWADGPLKDDAAFQALLRSRRAELDPDARLADTLQRRPVVLGFHVEARPDTRRAGALPSPLTRAPATATLPRFESFGGNLARFAQAARGAGFLDSWVDPDGVRRRAPLLAAIDRQVYGAFALEVLRVGLQARDVRVLEQGGHAVAVELAGPAGVRRLPLGRHAGVVLPFAGVGGQVRAVSAVDVLRSRVPIGSLRGHWVIVGTSAAGLGDRHATPVAEYMAGVQVHANLLGALRDGPVATEPRWAPWLEAATLVTLLLLITPLAWRRMWPAAAMAAGLLVLLVGANATLWFQGHWAVPLAGPLLLLLALVGWRLVYGRVWEQRDRRRLEALFGLYVPPELVEHMSRDPGHYDMRGRNAELTVLFADLRGFTRLSEQLAPADLAALMNDFLSAMTDIVRQHGGTLDKYIGDAVMAFWGAPVDDPAHATHAVAAGQAMLARMADLNAGFARRGWPALSLGIGINSGVMVVGDLGSRHRRAYTVLGDAVNVAARLQESTPRFGVDLLLGEATRDRLSAERCRLVATAQLRGRAAPVTIYTLA